MSWIGEDIVALATVMEAVVLAPVLFEFLIERRKRRQQVDLSLEIIDGGRISGELAGMNDLLANIRDLVDRARHPDAYAALRQGNEILIIGPPLSGKKALAKRIAKDVGVERIIIVHNPRNGDALARAKSLVARAQRAKVMLLLPRLDLIDGRAGEEQLVELDALIEAASERSHVLVVGTASVHRPGGEVDNLFGTVLTLPGTEIISRPRPPLSEEVNRMLAEVVEHYLNKSFKAGFVLSDLSRDGFVARTLLSVTNPAEIEDIVGLCETTALYRTRAGLCPEQMITPELLEIAIRRVAIESV